MILLRPALIFAFTATIGVGRVVFADETNPRFPAVEIVKAIHANELRNDATPDVAPLSEAAYEWDPEEAPEMMRSWLYLNLEDHVLERLENNHDEFGQPLF